MIRRYLIGSLSLIGASFLLIILIDNYSLAPFIWRAFSLFIALSSIIWGIKIFWYIDK